MCVWSGFGLLVQGGRCNVTNAMPTVTWPTLFDAAIRFKAIHSAILHGLHAAFVQFVQH